MTYNRERVLSQLFPTKSFVAALLSASPAERIQRLETHLYAAQALLGRGHWNGSISRVLALREAIACERAELEQRRAA